MLSDLAEIILTFPEIQLLIKVQPLVGIMRLSIAEEVLM